MTRTSRNRELVALLGEGPNKHRNRLSTLCCCWRCCHCDGREGLGRSSQCNKREVLAAVCCSMGPIAMGAMMGYSSPTIDDLEDEGLVNRTKASLFGSIITLGAFLGALTTGGFIDRFGRKMGLLTSGVVFLLGWLPIVGARGIEEILLGRFVTGFAGGMSMVVTPVYVAEVTSSKTRGLLGTFVMSGFTLGTLIVFSCGLLMSWRWLAIVCAIPALVLVFSALWLPETPRSLLQHNQSTTAHDVLLWLRKDASVAEQELSEIKTSIEEQPRQVPWSHLLRGDILRPLLLCSLIMTLQQFAGINAVIFYTETIFKAAGYSGNPGVPPVLIAAVKVMSALTASFFVDRLGRKTLFVATGIPLSLSCFMLGVYFYWLQDRQVAWISVLCLVVYMMSFCSGWAAVPWVFSSEIFPTEVRGSASTIVTAFSWISAFIVTLTFLPASEVIGIYGVFWGFSGVCVLGTIVAAIFQPETKGKSLEEIRQLFL